MKANRETIVLITAACAITLALAYGARTPPAAPVAATPVAAQQVWTGHLAEVAPDPSTAPTEPLSSASLVVPKSAMALPASPRKAPTKLAAAPVTPVRTQVASNTAPATSGPVAVSHDDSLLHNLNPMNHLPDMASVRRPFAYAGETVAGWFRHF